MTRPSLIAVLAAGILALGAVPALAEPGDDARITTTNISLTFNSSGANTAFCEGGATAIGGGVGAVNSLPLNLAINVSAPLDKTDVPAQTRTGDRPREWHASVYSGQGSTQDVRISAVCSKSAKAELKVKTFKVNPFKTTGTVVSCPKGQRALGGGMDIATAPEDGLYEEASGPLGKHGNASSVQTGDSPRRWMAAVYSGYGFTRTYRALVICSAKARPTIVSAETDVAPNDTVENIAACPAGTRAFGGGVLQLGKPQSQLQLIQNTPLGPSGTVAGTTDGDVPEFWDAAFYNRSDATASFNVLAVCG